MAVIISMTISMCAYCVWKRCCKRGHAVAPARGKAKSDYVKKFKNSCNVDIFYAIKTNIK